MAAQISRLWQHSESLMLCWTCDEFIGFIGLNPCYLFFDNSFFQTPISVHQRRSGRSVQSFIWSVMLNWCSWLAAIHSSLLRGFQAASPFAQASVSLGEAVLWKRDSNEPKSLLRSNPWVKSALMNAHRKKIQLIPKSWIWITSQFIRQGKNK